MGHHNWQHESRSSHTLEATEANKPHVAGPLFTSKNRSSLLKVN